MLKDTACYVELLSDEIKVELIDLDLRFEMINLLMEKLRLELGCGHGAVWSLVESAERAHR